MDPVRESGGPSQALSASSDAPSSAPPSLVGENMFVFVIVLADQDGSLPSERLNICLREIASRTTVGSVATSTFALGVFRFACPCTSRRPPWTGVCVGSSRRAGAPLPPANDGSQLVSQLVIC